MASSSKNIAQPSKATKKDVKATKNKDTKTASTSATDTGKLDFDQFANVDDVLKSFMEQDPQLRQHWEQLADSCSKAGVIMQTSMLNILYLTCFFSPSKY